MGVALFCLCVYTGGKDKKKAGGAAAKGGKGKKGKKGAKDSSLPKILPVSTHTQNSTILLYIYTHI